MELSGTSHMRDCTETKSFIVRNFLGGLPRGGCSWGGSYQVEVTGSSKVNKSFSSEISQDGSFGNRT